MNFHINVNIIDCLSRSSNRLYVHFSHLNVHILVQMNNHKKISYQSSKCSFAIFKWEFIILEFEVSTGPLKFLLLPRACLLRSLNLLAKYLINALNYIVTLHKF